MWETLCTYKIDKWDLKTRMLHHSTSWSHIGWHLLCQSSSRSNIYRQVLGKRKLKGDVYILCGLISWRVMNFVSKHMIVTYSSMHWRTLSHAGPKLLHISKRRKSKSIFCLQRCHSYLCISSAHLINYSRFIYTYIGQIIKLF